MSLVHAMRVQILKRRAKRLYLAYRSAHSGFDCGYHLAEHITGGRAERIAQSFDAVMDRLAALGEPVPQERLSRGGKT